MKPVEMTAMELGREIREKRMTAMDAIQAGFDVMDRRQQSLN